MTILKQLILDISQAITTYQAEKNAQAEVISPERQQNIVDLNQLLTASQQSGSDKSAYRLRKKLIDYIDQMPGSWLANLMTLFDGSRLRKLLHAVLAKPEFSENELLAQEAIELRDRQQRIGTAQNGDDLLEKLDLLTEEIKKKTQQAMLAMASSDQFSTACDALGIQTQALINKNRALQQELNALQTQLTEQLDALKAKVREQDELIQGLNKANQQLRIDNETERKRSIKIQKKLDEIKPKYTASLETITHLESLLKKHGIQATELQTFEKKSDTFAKQHLMLFSLEAH